MVLLSATLWLRLLTFEVGKQVRGSWGAEGFTRCLTDRYSDNEGKAAFRVFRQYCEAQGRDANTAAVIKPRNLQE